MNNTSKRMSAAGLLIAIGIVYGDIGTSPLYVMKSIVEGNGGIGNVNRDFYCWFYFSSPLDCKPC